jgi:hypothetical protein
MGRWQVVQQSNVTRDHATLASSFYFELRRRWDAIVFNVETADVVRTPDIVVEPRGGDPNALGTDAAVILVEVRSPSSVKTDFVDQQIRLAARDVSLPLAELYRGLSVE